MSFVSYAFPIFLLVVFVLYYLFPRVAVQNVLIVVSSLVFYAFWDWRFLPLLVGTGLVSYVSARMIAVQQNAAWRRVILWVTVAVALSVLGVFKYFNFFVASAASFGTLFGLQLHPETLQIILPLGISFMTFQGLAYVIDVYRGDQDADRDIVRVMAFKTFFPQLVAGPIERAKHLLVQFAQPRVLTGEKVKRAVWLLIYGFTMKIVVADSMAAIVDSLFVPEQVFGWSVVFGTLAFGIQIYADFCGYSLIAKGTALLFGFELIWNFRFPYWAVSISDFWRRWHIGLSNWLRDYLYIPLGGNRRGEVIAARNMLITMCLGGLWHGASWNFVLWGLLHGLALGIWRYSPAPTMPVTPVGRALGWAVTMVIVFVGWFLFRASDWTVLTAMTATLNNWEWAPVHGDALRAVVAIALPIALLEWLLQKRGDYFLLESTPALTYATYSAMIVLTAAMSGSYKASFIYFQF